MTPLPKGGFGFPVQKSTTQQTRSSFGGVQKCSGERVLWYVFLPPYVLHPPHITAQTFFNGKSPDTSPERKFTKVFWRAGKVQGPLNRGVSNGGFRIWTCPSFFVPFGTFPIFPRDFPDLSGDSPKIFPIRPFPLSGPTNFTKSTYEEQSPKGPRHNLDLSQKKWETPRFGNPPV